MPDVLTIAEIAQAHDGSLGILHSYIDALADTGVDVVKFQTHIAAAESSEFEPFRVNFSYQDHSRFDYWKRMEFSQKEWEEIKAHCEDVGLEFMSSPFSNAAVDLLESLGVSRYKIGSGEVSNLLLLDKLASTGKPLILSSGMSSYPELDQAVSFLQTRGSELFLMQCTTAYPTTPSQWGLNVIGEMRSRYHLPVGYSDHSGEIYACLAATALGAEMLEFHVVFDQRMFGPDAKASLSVDQVDALLQGVKKISAALQTPIDKSETTSFRDLKNIFEKSLAVNKDLPTGSVLELKDLEAKKPLGMGIPASHYQAIIGKKLTRDMQQWDFIATDDLADE